MWQSIATFPPHMKTWGDAQKQGLEGTHRFFKIISKWKIKSILFYNYYYSTIENSSDHKTCRWVRIQQYLQHDVDQFKPLINFEDEPRSLSELSLEKLRVSSDF